MLAKLKKGDTIGIINPSFHNGDNPYEKYQYMIDKFTSLGYKLKFGKTFLLKNGYFAGDDRARINDINEMFADKEVKAIICMRGGYGATRILDQLDYQTIKNNPKIFGGYSDITALLNTFYSKCGFVTMHSLIALNIGSEKLDDYSSDNFWDLLTKDQKGRVLKNNDDKCVTMHEGKCEGVLVGGNLTLICAMQGTPYEIDFTDKIVFIEDVDEKPFRIDRYLSTLKLSKSLEKAKGFVFGYFTDCVDNEGQTVDEIIDDYFKDFNKPMIKNFACGHDLPFVSLPIGAKCTLDADNKQIIIEEEIYHA